MTRSPPRKHLIAVAQIAVDRRYFEQSYDEWLRHRSKWKKYEVWLAVALTAFGGVLVALAPELWPVGALFATAGVFEFVLAATHRRRWIRARLAKVPAGSSVQFRFDEVSLTTVSRQGTGTLRLDALSRFTPGSQGFFLIGEDGFSMYIPRAAVEPGDSYPALTRHLQFVVGRSSLPTGG